MDRRVRWALAAQALRDNPERFLATVQVGITVIGTTAGAFGGSTLAVHLIPLFQAVPWLTPYAEEVAVGLVVIFISYLAIVAGELVPKSLAMRIPEVYARLVAIPLGLLSKVSSPAVRLLAGSSNLLLKVFGDRTSFVESRLSTEEIRYLVEDAAKVGSLHPEAGSIVSRAIDFGELRVVDVMVPRNAVVSVEPEASLDEAVAQLERTPFSRLLVHTKPGEEMLGYLAAKDLLLRRHAGKRVRDLVRPAIHVPELLPAINLLQRLQRERQQIAFVVDEQGSFAGLVTMEDLLEELVGEIFSEFREEHVPDIRWAADGTALVPGNFPLREVNRRLDLDLRESPYWTTLGGLYLGQAGRIPSSGESLALGGGVSADILEVKGARLVAVRLHKPAVQDEQGASPA